MRCNAAAIVGGGNVAMDAARCAKRMGTEHVYIVYRRSEEEMPARLEEVHHAKEEGIEFLTLNNPTKILGDEDGKVKGMECIKMELGEPDESGRRSPVPVPGSEFVLNVDAVIMAIGTSPNPLIRTTTTGVEANRRGCLIVNEEMCTTREGEMCIRDSSCTHQRSGGRDQRDSLYPLWTVYLCMPHEVNAARP